MATAAELDVLVKEKVSALRKKGEEVSPDIIARAIHHRREDVLSAYTRFCDAERAEQEEKIKRAISQSIGAEIIKDRDTLVAGVTKIRDEHIDHLQCTEVLLVEEIGSLRTELSAMQKQAENDSNAINTLHQSNSVHVGQIQELRGQVEAKVVELSVERHKGAEIFATVAELNQTLGEKKYEAQAERTRAAALQAQRDEMEKRLKETELKLVEGGFLSDHRQEKFSDLATRLQNVEKQLADERKARLEAVKNHAEAKARAEVFEGQLEGMKNTLAATRTDQPTE